MIVGAHNLEEINSDLLISEDDKTSQDDNYLKGNFEGNEQYVEEPTKEVLASSGNNFGTSSDIIVEDVIAELLEIVSIEEDTKDQAPEVCEETEDILEVSENHNDKEFTGQVSNHAFLAEGNNVNAEEPYLLNEIHEDLFIDQEDHHKLEELLAFNNSLLKTEIDFNEPFNTMFGEVQIPNETTADNMSQETMESPCYVNQQKIEDQDAQHLNQEYQVNQGETVEVPGQPEKDTIEDEAHNFDTDEEKVVVPFFFTPRHGLVLFIVLYFLVLMYSRDSSDNNVKAAEDSNNLTILAAEEQDTLPAYEDDTFFEKDLAKSLSFEEAKEIFEILNCKEEIDKRELNRALAFLIRASGEHTHQVPYGILVHFWEEVCSLSTETAKERFIEVIEALNNDLLNSASDMVTEDGNHIVVKWWESKTVESSFDSTDISSISTTINQPSPIKDEQQGNHVSVQDMLNKINLQESIFKNIQPSKNDIDQTREIILGTVIGAVGTAFMFRLASKVREFI